MNQTIPPSIVILDPEMESIVDPNAEFEQIASGMRFTEGPVWLPDRQVFVYSDIPASKMYCWTRPGGLGVFREPSNKANGNTLDNQGRQLTCEEETRRLTRTEPDGTITVLADRYQGRKLNSTNDVVVKRDNTIWFTDPTYGLRGRPSEQPGNYVYRLDPGASEPVPVATDFAEPNGLCFSPDEQFLYIADSHVGRHLIRRFRVTKSNGLEDDGLFAVITPHIPDGMRIDSKGRIFTTAGDGVQVFRPDGTMVGKFLTPQVAANCCFGGADGKSLFITASSSVWRVALQ